MLGRVARAVARPALRWLREQAHRLGAYAPRGQIDAGLMDEFVRLNQPHWPAPPLAAEGATILVEGHVSHCGPNYLARTAVAARTLQSCHGGRIMVVFPGYPHEWLESERAYRSFGIANFVYLTAIGSAWRTLWEAPAHLIDAARRVLQQRTPRDILSIELSGIPAGDLIYDDVLRVARVPTIRGERFLTWLVVFRAMRMLASYRPLFVGRRVRFLVSTHAAYCEYGLLVRAALAQGATVVETTDTLNSVHRTMSTRVLPTYHQGIENWLAEAMTGVDPARRTALIAAAREQLGERLEGQLNQVDVARAYKDKKVYAAGELRRKLGLSDERPFAFVFAHVFNDSPHISSHQLYNDYYQWLDETLRLVAASAQCHWIVKPHPSAALYGEQGMVESMVSALRAAHVHNAPDDLSPASAAAAARCIVTVQGTVGLEYACKGVPTIAAGQAFYSGFGFTLQPASMSDYADLLSRAHELPPLAPAQVEQALLVYGLWNQLAGFHSDLIDQALMRKVWGYEDSRSLDEAYRMINERLRTRSFHELDIARFVAEARL